MNTFAFSEISALMQSLSDDTLPPRIGYLETVLNKFISPLPKVDNCRREEHSSPFNNIPRRTYWETVLDNPRRLHEGPDSDRSGPSRKFWDVVLGESSPVSTSSNSQPASEWSTHFSTRDLFLQVDEHYTIAPTSDASSLPRITDFLDIFSETFYRSVALDASRERESTGHARNQVAPGLDTVEDDFYCTEHDSDWISSPTSPSIMLTFLPPFHATWGTPSELECGESHFDPARYTRTTTYTLNTAGDPVYDPASDSGSRGTAPISRPGPQSTFRSANTLQLHQPQPVRPIPIIPLSDFARSLESDSGSSSEGSDTESWHQTQFADDEYEHPRRAPIPPRSVVSEDEQYSSSPSPSDDYPLDNLRERLERLLHCPCGCMGMGL